MSDTPDVVTSSPLSSKDKLHKDADDVDMGEEEDGVGPCQTKMWLYYTSEESSNFVNLKRNKRKEKDLIRPTCYPSERVER